MKSKHRILITLTTAVFYQLATSASAQSTYTWDTTASGNTGSWGTATNWTADAVPTANDTASFTTAASPATVTLDGDRNIKSLVFSNASASWTLNEGSVAGSTLNFTDGDTTAGENTSFVTVTDTTVHLNVTLGKTIASGTANASDGIIFNGSGGTVNFAGTLNGPRANPNYLHLGSNGTAGTTGMIYNINTANSLKNRLYVGFNNTVGTVPVNLVAGTTVNINASQAFGENIENAVAGGSNAANAGVMIIRNGANWDQSVNSLLVGLSSTTGTFASHGRVEVGVVGDSTGSLLIGNGGGLTIGNRGGTGILNVSNGTVTINANSDTATTNLGGATANLNLSGGGNGTINLNSGGTIVTARQFATQQAQNGTSATASGTGTFNFDGGLLRINRATGLVTTDLFEDNITVNILNGGARIDTQANNSAFDEALNGVGNGGLEKLGAGMLTLNGTNTYNGGTLVNTGTLNIASAGSINTSSGVTVAAGAKFVYNSSTSLSVGTTLSGDTIANRAVLGGTGTIATSVTLDNLGDTLSPGNSPGIQNYSAAQTWSSFSYDWEVNNFIGTTAGTNFDQITLGSTLELSGGSGSYILNVLGLNAQNESGLVPNFSEINRSWTILTSADTLSGFNAANWTINTAGFTDPTTGSWALDQSDNNLVLSYTVIPEPSAALLGGLGLLILLRRRR